MIISNIGPENQFEIRTMLIICHSVDFWVERYLVRIFLYTDYSRVVSEAKPSSAVSVIPL